MLAAPLGKTGDVPKKHPSEIGVCRACHDSGKTAFLRVNDANIGLFSEIASIGYVLVRCKIEKNLHAIG